MDLSAAEKPAPDNNTLIHITIISIVVFLLALFCIQLSEQSENLAPLWFPTAVLMVALFHHPTRYWSLQLLTAGICIVAANFILYGISWFPLPLTIINLAESATGAWLLRKFLQPKDPLNNLFSWLKFSICTVVIVPLLSGLAAAWYLSPQNGYFMHVLTVWFMSEAIGMLALGPVGLLYRRGYFNIATKTKALFDMMWMMILSLAACYIGLIYFPFPFTFVIMALIWVSIRLPRFETFILCFLSTLLIALMINFNLFTLPPDPKMSVQAFSFIPLLMVLIPPHAMAMVMHSFRMEKEHIVESENRFRNAMEYSAIGMALVSPEGKWMQVNQALCKLLGYNQDTLLTLTFQQITHPDDLSADLKLLDDLYYGRIPSYSMEKRYVRSDGEIVWTLLVVSVVRDHEQQPLYYISQVEDINDLKKTEIINRRLMERITLANEAGGIGIWELDLRTQVISWDKRMYELYHVPLNTPVTDDVWKQYIHPEDIDYVINEYSAALKQRKPYRLEFRLLLPNGEIVHLRNQANMVCDKNGNILRLIGTTLDMTEIRNLTEALHEEKERLHITLDSIGEAVVCTDQEMRITFMNPVAEKMTGWANTIALGQPINQIVKLTNGVDGPEIDNPIEHCLTHRPYSSLNESMVLHHRDGQYYDIQESVAPLKTLEGAAVGAVLVFQDVGESRAMMRKLSHSASHDNLTGLPNRANFENKLKMAIQQSIDQNQQHALAFLDLDYFKAVNDTAGHPAGDALLKELSQLMRQHLRNSDCVARLGGDEFGLLMLNCTLPHAKAITQNLVTLINGYHFYWEEKLYRIGASAGVTQISSNNSQRSEIMAQADIACYTAKHSGRGQVYLYQPRQKQLLARQHELLSRDDVESILNHDQLRLQVTPAAPPKTPLSVCFYQVSYEVYQPQSMIVSQSAFEEAALLYHLQGNVDGWVCEKLLVEHAEAISHKGLALAIPLSEVALLKEDFRQSLLTLVQNTVLPAQSLHWMVDESTLLQYPFAIGNFLAKLQQLGCKLIIKEFGHNLNDFELLAEHHIDYLKFNSELIAHIHINQMDEVLVSIINGTAQRANIATLAGPADLAPTLNKLITIGVDLADGETIGRTQPLSDVLNNGYFAIK
ncbi:MULTISPECIES: diguanylate cyclase [Yersinia]|uniref:diguanylate cyclase n=1 Tax=Yersinia TaxID=629 RepID=UPI0005E4C370|nr:MULTISPECIES: diguanylate cyclase [Yersinia]OVZ97494.1 diguanylate cyclase [Yersinia frederiksenii]RXA96170.1 diguanylate cyclase [Yersinia sp. 2105 StPb PI]CNI89245.1 putative sensor protein [Yersinia frederiksenii]CNJ06891.1 putative sensor protein [Yersinia frederiksenii]